MDEVYSDQCYICWMHYYSKLQVEGSDQMDQVCSDAAADGAGGGEAAGFCSSHNSDLIELHLKWLLMQPAKQG